MLTPGSTRTGWMAPGTRSKSIIMLTVSWPAQGWLPPSCQVVTSAFRAMGARSPILTASPKLRMLGMSCLLAEMSVGRVGYTRAVLHPH